MKPVLPKIFSHRCYKMMPSLKDFPAAYYHGYWKSLYLGDNLGLIH